MPTFDVMYIMNVINIMFINERQNKQKNHSILMQYNNIILYPIYIIHTYTRAHPSAHKSVYTHTHKQQKD